MRRPGESYSDVILSLAALKARRWGEGSLVLASNSAKRLPNEVRFARRKRPRGGRLSRFLWDAFYAASGALLRDER
jgi:hypothetical protein